MKKLPLSLSNGRPNDKKGRRALIIRERWEEKLNVFVQVRSAASPKKSKETQRLGKGGEERSNNHARQIGNTIHLYTFCEQKREGRKRQFLQSKSETPETQEKRREGGTGAAGPIGGEKVTIPGQQVAL